MESADIWTIALGMVLLAIVFVLAESAKRTAAIAVLLVLIPFQVVETRYASSSVLMAYGLTFLLILKGGFRTRMLPALGFIVVTFLISLSAADRVILSLHVFYLFQFFSCLAVFLLAYNYARLVKVERDVVDLLLVINVLTLGYCGLQFIAGPGAGFSLFGIEALSTNINREFGDARLVGPFGNPGSTAGYFTLMTLVCAVDLMYARGGRRLLVQLVVSLNLLCMVATANRGAFLVFVAMFPFMLFVFRQELGVRRALQYALGGFTALAIVSAIAVNYTDFGLMYERMTTVTEMENGVPSTRQNAWPDAIEKIKKDPWLGEGPFFVYKEAAEKLGWPRENFDNYPHSLYLYLLRTVGIVGLASVMFFFAQAWFVFLAALRRDRSEAYETALIKLGLVLIPAFLLDQVRLEFLRQTTMDYGHFIFALIGLLVGVSDRGAAVSGLVGDTPSGANPIAVQAR